MAKENYDNFSREDLIHEVKKLKERKKYGIVWDEEKTKEKFEKNVKGKLPVLEDATNKEIVTNKDKSFNILIEGDNYHALSVLNYTHREKIDVIYIDPPYNTGARDWKYNNHYVDKNDTYRHSKWLSMMFKRLKLGRWILKRNGVLIVTVDDHELFGLLGLLEKLHPTLLGVICICIKPEGRRQSKYIMESHEYALFVTWGNPTMRGLNADFGLNFPEKDSTSKFRWEGLMRRDAAREDRSSDYWYPFYVSKDSKISITKKDSYNEVWPINTKGIERVWLWDKERATNNLNELNAIVRNNRITIYYKRRELGRIKPTSFWHGSKYNANAYGTRLLASILPQNNFDYPKSLYSVLDCIDIFLPENGTVVDFFAGSGTTGHAVLELNKQDNGSRKFILCTNNENNICTEVCYPRIRKVIKGYKNAKGEKINGLEGNLKYFKTDFVDAVSTDLNKKKLVDKSTEMLCLKEDCFDDVKIGMHHRIFKNYHGDYLGIIYDDKGIKKFKEEIKSLNKKITVYVFSLDDSAREEDFEDIKDMVDLKSIPEIILNVYRRIFR